MQFAGLLARTVVHTLDVLGMLKVIGPAQFRWWKKLYEVAPWGDEWRQTTTICAAAHNAGLTAGGYLKDEHVKSFASDEFLPPEHQKKKKRVSKAENSPDELQAQLAAKYGPKV